MTPLSILLELDEATAAEIEKSERWQITKIVALPGVTNSGRAAVAIVVELEDGRKVVATTTMRLFTMAARAFLARFGEDGGGAPPDRRFA